MNDLETFWQGTFEIWQNKDFGEIYAEYSNRKRYLIDNIQIFVSHRPLIGNVTLYLYCAPFEGDWLSKLVSLAKNLNTAKIWIYSANPLQTLSKFSKEELLTLILNLTDDKEVIWKTIGDKTRNMIRKGRKNKVNIKLVEEEKEFNEWWNVYSNVSQTKGFGKQNYLLVKTLFREKKLAKLFVSVKDNKIIGGSFFLTDKYPVYWLGAFDRNYGNCAPSHINIWEAIISFKENGYKLLDLGGIALNREDGTTLFKKSFGGEMKKGYIYEMSVNKFKTCVLEFISQIKNIKR